MLAAFAECLQMMQLQAMYFAATLARRVDEEAVAVTPAGTLGAVVSGGASVVAQAWVLAAEEVPALS